MILISGFTNFFCQDEGCQTVRISFHKTSSELLCLVTSHNLAESLVYSHSWFVLSLRLVPESARWLVVKGRRKEAEEVLRKMAAANGKTYPENLDLSPLFEVFMHVVFCHNDKSLYGKEIPQLRARLLCSNFL